MALCRSIVAPAVAARRRLEPFGRLDDQVVAAGRQRRVVAPECDRARRVVGERQPVVKVDGDHERLDLVIAVGPCGPGLQGTGSASPGRGLPRRRRGLGRSSERRPDARPSAAGPSVTESVRGVDRPTGTHRLVLSFVRPTALRRRGWPAATPSACVPFGGRSIPFAESPQAEKTLKSENRPPGDATPREFPASRISAAGSGRIAPSAPGARRVVATCRRRGRAGRAGRPACGAGPTRRACRGPRNRSRARRSRRKTAGSRGGRGGAGPWKSGGHGPVGQFEGVAEVAAGERRVVEILERDPPERDVDPEVIAAPLERVPEGVAGAFGVAGLPDLDPFLVVELHLGDAAGVDQLEVVAAEPSEVQAAGAPRRGRRACGPAGRRARRPPPASSRRPTRPRFPSSPRPGMSRPLRKELSIPACDQFPLDQGYRPGAMRALRRYLAAVVAVRMARSSRDREPPGRAGPAVRHDPKAPDDEPDREMPAFADGRPIPAATPRTARTSRRR